MKPLVIYHDHCTDGFGAAFAAWCKLGDSAEYLPMSYGPVHPADFIDLVQDRDLYVLDFSFPKPIMELAISHAAKLVWLDHHKTAFEMWCPKHGLPKFVQTEAIPTLGSKPVTCHIVLDDNQSGAMLAWGYFHPDKDVPDLISYIDDRDRWVFNYGTASKALHAGLQTLQPWKFREWADLVPAMGGSTWALNEVTDAGYTILNIYDKQIADRVKVAEKCSIRHPDGNLEHNPWEWNQGGVWCAPGLAVNSPIHQSEIGNELAKASGTYGLVWYYDSATKRANVSLRSIGDYDVSAIAKAFGGGGHRNAAGFNIDMSTILGFL